MMIDLVFASCLKTRRKKQRMGRKERPRERSEENGKGKRKL